MGEYRMNYPRIIITSLDISQKRKLYVSIRGGNFAEMSGKNAIHETYH